MSDSSRLCVPERCNYTIGPLRPERAPPLARRQSITRLEAPLSLAEKTKRALAEHQAAEDEAKNKRRRHAELSEAARKAGPAQLDTLAVLLKAKGDAMNSESLAGFPNFKFVPVNHRLDAGKYAIELSPYAAFDPYAVTIRAGTPPQRSPIHGGGTRYPHTGATSDCLDGSGRILVARSGGSKMRGERYLGSRYVNSLRPDSRRPSTTMRRNSGCA